MEKDSSHSVKRWSTEMGQRCWLLSVCCLLLCASCRTDDDIVMPTVTEVDHVKTDYLGLYVLCEGNMGSNKATLDYLDLANGQYCKNIFPSRNPNQVKELGDVGNDAKIYGQRLWLVINCSNKVEVCTADSAFSLGHVDIPNCRYLAFHKGYAYVSSYVGPVGGASELGSVYKVDTLTLRIAGQITVGYQPEEMAVVGDKLYVANSGGYNAMQGNDYDHRLSVIDLNSFTEERKINVGPNLFRVRADRQGRLWVASYNNPLPGALYLLQTDANGQMQVTDTLQQMTSDFDIVGDTLYYCGDRVEGSVRKRFFGAIDIRARQTITDHLLQLADDGRVDTPDGLQRINTPQGIKVHPLTGAVYIMDGTNYVSSGWLWCFDREGRFQWRVSTGDIPAHACWLKKETIISNNP